MKELTVGTLSICESCLEGKMTKRPFFAKGQRATQPLELVNSDVCGPLTVQARGGYEYYVTFIDDYSRYALTYLKFMEFKS